MSVFFNGRLLISPATASMVDDNAMRNKNLSVGNAIAYLGESDGGDPNKVLKFGSPAEARAVLRNGPLLDAVERAFDPSPQTFGPSTVMALRVNPATPSSLMLKAAGAVDVINVASTDSGLWTEQIMLRVWEPYAASNPADTRTKRVATKVGQDYFESDDILRDVFTLRYTGAEASATMTISGTQVVLKAPSSGTPVTITLSAYDTVAKLVDKINTVAGFTASVLSGQDGHATVQALDFIADQDVRTASHTVTADLQAVVDWINGYGEGLVTATRVLNVGAAPSAIGWTALSGGTNGATTVSDWANTFETLQAEDVQWVVPLSSDASIHAQALAHCVYMSNVARNERRCFVGGAIGQTEDEVKAAAKALNSDRSAQCYPGFWDYNRDGKMTLYPSYMTAAMVGAAFAGSNPGTALTNKAMRVRGLERKLRNPTDTDGLIEAGILCVEDTKAGYKVVKSVTTWQLNDNYNRVEVSTGFAVDFTVRNVRNALDGLRGEKATPALIAEAASRTETTLHELARHEPMGPGVLVGDAESPAYKNITVSLEGDVTRVEFECSPVIPNNYTLVVLHAVPYSGSAKI